MQMRRSILFIILSLVFSANSIAQTDIFVRGSGRKFPLALPKLCTQQADGSIADEIPSIIARDLDLSGYFEIINQKSYVETPGKCGDNFAYSDWSIVGAEGLVKGIVSGHGDGVKVQLYLHDVQKNKAVLGKEYEGDLSQISRIAHKFSNEIMKFFTGEAGVFGTQIAFSTKVGRFKELAVMDMDGSNIRQLTNEKGLAMSASWSPSGQKIVYTSYRMRTPDLFLLDVLSARVSQITKSSALEVGAKFSADGRYLLTSIDSGADSDIVLIGLDGKIVSRLTRTNSAIDVSPNWSPDGSKIVFCSNRGGGPQIYTMNADGSDVKRVSYMTSSYCTSPSWSPKGDRIALVCRENRGFQIFSVNADGTDAQQLTSVGDNEDPDWSPDGRYLVYATTFGRGSIFNLALMRSDGSNVRSLTSSRTGFSDPAWGPADDYSRNLRGR